MPKLDVSGIEEFSSFLSSLEREINGILKMGIYNGADIIADTVRASIEALPIDHGKATEERKLNGINEIQKRGLLDNFGISPMDDKGGFINVKIGFSGYNDIKTKQFPKGQPNVLVARSIESGSSVSQKTPFVRPALNRSKKQAIEAVQQTVTNEVKKLERR